MPTKAFCAFLLALFAGCNGNPSPTKTPPSNLTPTKLVLLHINDLHGQMLPRPAFWVPKEKWTGNRPPLVGGVAAITDYVNRVRSEAGGADVLFLDSGDWFQGTPEGNVTAGKIVIDWFNRMGLAVTVVGNHDFDYGWQNLVSLIHQAQFPVLGANVIPQGMETNLASAPQPAAYLKPYWVKKINNTRILFFGLILKDAFRVTGGDVGPVVFAAEEEVFRAWLPRLRAESDQIILLSHCGWETDRRLAQALQDVPKLRIILGGHSHTLLKRPKVFGHIRVFQTHGIGTEINHIEYDVVPQQKRLKFKSFKVVELALDKYAQDQDTKRWLAEQTVEIRKNWDVPIGSLTGNLWRTRARKSSAAGNFAADAARQAAKATIGLANKGGLRCNIPEGPVTRRDIFRFMPFSNTIVVLKLTGAEILEMFNKYFQSKSSLPEISGIRVSYKGKKVTAITLDSGKPLEPDTIYTVAANSYMADQGDKSGILRNKKARRETGILARQAILALFGQGKNLTVSSENRYRRIR